MKAAGKPLKAGEIATASGLDKKEVDKAMKELKDKGLIVSPVRCCWEPKNKERGFSPFSCFYEYCFLIKFNLVCYPDCFEK